MGWPASILTGFLMAAFGTVYGYVVANAAADWRHISGFEGKAGYFVVLCALLGLVAGLIVGLVASRFLGGPGWIGFFRGLGWSALITGGAITLLGATAWLTADREPTVAGHPLDLLIELSVPAGLRAGVDQLSSEQSTVTPYVILFGDSASRQGDLDLARGRTHGGRWILAGRVEIHNTSQQRVLGVALRTVPEQYFDLPLPGRPGLTPDWSEWLTGPTFGDRTPPAAEDAFALRFRVVARPVASEPQDAQ